jgi:DNA-directed RNA polymerase subunit RPC12/RpoP
MERCTHIVDGYECADCHSAFYAHAGEQPVGMPHGIQCPFCASTKLVETGDFALAVHKQRDMAQIEQLRNRVKILEYELGMINMVMAPHLEKQGEPITLAELVDKLLQVRPHTEDTRKLLQVLKVHGFAVPEPFKEVRNSDEGHGIHAGTARTVDGTEPTTPLS